MDVGLIWVDACWGSLGGVLALPFMAYFAMNGALYDMMYGTILYNFDYTKHIGFVCSRHCRHAQLL